MSSDQAATTTTHPGRKRRAHKRSRNGCMTCKQRHIRCDELKPVCTNCLTRGGECGYAEAVARTARGDTPGSSSTTTTRHGSQGQQQQKSLSRIPGQMASSPADPFDSLPIKMPLRSLELFHHFVHYRIFSRTAVRKNPNSQCVGIALSNPGTFRACLIMTALHHSWLSSTTNALAKSYPDMEETYIYHKIEAIRLVNEQITNPNMCTSDDCLSLIAGLALAESGMGNCVAAEAHLNGLSTLIDMKRPEEWQHRFYGMLQRIILMAGSFIAASKTPSGDNSDYDSPLIPDYSKTPSPLFSTARFAATRLSPFYLSSTPCLEACKADVEGEVLINALRRLTSTCFSSTSPFSAPSPTSSPRSSYSASPAADSRVITSVLLSDTEAYIASLLFKPDHFETSLSSPPSSPPSSSSPRVSSRKKRKRQFRTRDDHPYQNLPAELFPCSSRAWATAAYLYLHVVLAPLWDNHDAPSTPSSATAIPKRHKIDPHLLRFLFDTLKEDTAATEEAALRIGAYSSELWVWKVMLGAYVAEITEQKDVYTDLISKDYCSAAASFRASATESEHRQDPDSSIGSVGDDDGDDDSDSDDDDGQEKKESNYLEEMRSFFKTKLASWSRCPQSKGTSEWSVAKQMLERIVWVPSSFSSRDDNDTHKMSFEAIIEKLWWEAVYCSPQAPRYQQEQQQQVVEEEDHHYIMATETMRRTSSPLVPVDPALR